MEDVMPLYENRPYGKIHVHLKELMDARGMNRNTMARFSQTRFEVVNKWYSGEVERIDGDVLARFCHILNCQPGDLLTYNLD